MAKARVPLERMLEMAGAHGRPGRCRQAEDQRRLIQYLPIYHEYLEGGHSVGADRSEDATRAALLWAFLTKEIGK